MHHTLGKIVTMDSKYNILIYYQHHKSKSSNLTSLYIK